MAESDRNQAHLKAGEPAQAPVEQTWARTIGISSVGIEMGVAVGVGYGIGWALDQQLGTEPYLGIVFLLFGVAAGFKGLIRAAREASRDLR
jgi:ATP synthase protein I